jgi:hypothetical protein
MSDPIRAGKTTLPNGNYPNPNDCTQFYTVENGAAWLQNCPACEPSPRCPVGILYFEPSRNACVYFNEASCNFG